MGDRANVVMRFDRDQAVFLYTHWGGYELPATLQEALSRRQRWDDEAYLARIIFCQMVSGSETEETGYGISPTPCDNEHDWLVVDCASKRVERRKFNRQTDQHAFESDLVNAWSFEQFTELDLAVAFKDY